MQQDSPHYAHCLEILGQSPLFASLDDALLENMLGIFHSETRVRGETAISPKQASDHLYIVISGRAKVSVYNPDSGREHILFLIGPGDGFDLIRDSTACFPSCSDTDLAQHVVPLEKEDWRMGGI